MAIRSILALLDGGPASEHAIAAAVQLGQTFDAHVEVLHVETPVDSFVPLMPEAASIASSARLADDLLADSRRRAEQARALFDTHCADVGLTIIDPGSERPATATFAWRLVSGHDNPELARRGRLFDLIIMARPDGAEGGVDSAALEAALFDTGRPVLIAGDTPLQIIGAHMAIAWDGSREATQSIGASLPLLQKAKTVTAVSVSDGDANNMTNGDLTDLAVYLRSHGIDPATKVIARHERSIAEALHQEMREQKVGLTVMGAYGHSVISEFLFGGVTRDMLKDQHLALFLAH